MKKFNFDKKYKLLLLICLTVFLSFQFGIVLAENVTTDNPVLEAGDTLNKTGFFSGDKVKIKGDINGSAFVVGSDIAISGNIDGDLFVTGQNIKVSGRVTGSVFAGGQDISIDGEVENNIYSGGMNIILKSTNNGSAFLAGNKVDVAKGSNINKDLFVGASQVFSRGEVGRNLFSSSDNISISGSVKNDAKLNASDIYIEAAKIDGSLNYESENKATISKDSEILGNVDWKKAEPQVKESKFTRSFLISIIFAIINAMIIWILVKLIRPRFWINFAENILISPLKSLGFGALALIVIPTTLFFLIISVVLYPLLFILTALFGISLYISKIIVAVTLGLWMEKRFNWPRKHMGVWTTLLGLVILSAIGVIPVLGFIVKLIVLFLGLGSIIVELSKRKSI